MDIETHSDPNPDPAIQASAPPPSIEEIVGDLHVGLQYGILGEFGDKSLDDVRKRLGEVDSDWVLEPYGHLRGSGFRYYFPVFEEYAGSSDSEFDCLFPGCFAMAVELQIMRRPEEAFQIEEKIRNICQFVMENFRKYYEDDLDWAATSMKTYQSILRRLDANRKERDKKDGARQPATAPDSKPESSEKLNPESEGRSQ